MNARVVNHENVGMIERRYGARFLFETLKAIAVSGELGGQDFDRHVAPQPRVAGAKDFTHSTGAERRQDLVGAEPGAWVHAGECWQRTAAFAISARLDRSATGPQVLFAFASASPDAEY